MSPIVIHGHFYQPPRENPWTGKLDREQSAAPFHDWNERIHAECYRPNGFARIFDEHGRVARIVNNYQNLSFNFGPTLLSWLERNQPDTYRRILEADRLSAERHHGHGNALAQGYNHAILPLCNPRDIITQLRWGIADFRHRFGRSPEAVWLPETACNDRTLGALIDFGQSYVILSPTQALRVRALDAGVWRDVSDGSIDPRLAYLYFHRDGSGRSIAIFFYDNSLARAVAFEGALSSSSHLIDRLVHAGGTEAKLVTLATDGESYGHHFPFGERCIAYALEHEAPERGLQVTNYGEFLEHNRPRAEVEIKPGPGGEGTAWSCVHGVGRWYRDCGCSSGAREGWNQQWRQPLRLAFDLLRDRAAGQFERTRADLFRDPWSARDHYIELLLEGERARAKFFEQHTPRGLGTDDSRRALRLLEAQRASMMMYTSCGWFFADISGLETVQVIKYAGRLLDLLEEAHLVAPRDEFLDALSAASSNIGQMGNGADIFHRFVEPCRTSPSRIAAHLAITSLAADGEAEGELGDYRFARSSHQKSRHGRVTMITSRLKLNHKILGERLDYAAAALHFGELDFYCALMPYPGDEAFAQCRNALWDYFERISLPALLRLIEREFGPDEFGLDSVLAEGRETLSEMVYSSLFHGLTAEFSRLYQDERRILTMLDAAGFAPPPLLRLVTQYGLQEQLETEIRARNGSLVPSDYALAARIAADIEQHHYQIDKSRSNQQLERMIARATLNAVARPGDDNIQAALTAIEIAWLLHLQPNLDHPQEIVYQARLNNSDAAKRLDRLAAALGLAPLS